MLDDFICTDCKVAVNNWEKSVTTPEPACPECGQPMKKNWASCRVMALNRGEPVNARIANDGSTINKFGAKDDPLCAIEVGLRQDNHSGLRTFTPEQARYYREKAAKEDSARLRKEILDVRERNISEKKYQKTVKDKQAGVIL